MTSALQLPAELWLQVFSFLPWSDKLSVRATCSHFRNLLDKSRPLWRGFCVTLQRLARYDRRFWRSLAQRHVAAALLRHATGKDLRQVCTRLPALTALRLDAWAAGGAEELRRLPRLERLTVTSGSAPLRDLDFLFPASQRLTRLSLCNVRLTCGAAPLLAAIGQLTRLTALLLHHDGSVHVPALGAVLAALPRLTHLSWTMVTYRALPAGFFGPAPPAAGGAGLHLSDLQLLNYDAVVTQEVLEPLSRLRSLSVFHLYSVPGPTCHLQTWLTALPELSSLSVHGGHPLAAYVHFLPPSLRSLTLCVDLQPDDLAAAALRTPHLEQLHLEPWGPSCGLVGLLPPLFPRLQTLRIRHRHVPDEDFLRLAELRQLRTLEVLDSYYRPAPDPGPLAPEPGPHLQRLVQELQRRTGHRVQVLTRTHRDPLSCHCV